MTKDLNIGITGATGHLGRILVPDLFESGYRLRCLFRERTPEELREMAEWIHGDLSAPGVIRDFVQGLDVLVHCASMISVGESNHEKVHEVNVEGVKHLTEACSSNGTKLIYISSSTATRDPKIGEELKEDSPYREDKGFYYGWTKAEAEKIIRKGIDRGSLTGFIFRPTALVGPPDFGPSRFGKVIWDMHLGRMKLLPEGGYNVLDIRDFSQAVVCSIEKGKNGKTYLTGGEYLSMKQLSKIANPSGKVCTLNIDLLLRILPAIDFLKPMVSSMKELNRESLLTLKYAPRAVDSSRAEKELGLQKRPIEETVHDLISWMKTQHK